LWLAVFTMAIALGGNFFQMIVIDPIGARLRPNRCVSSYLEVRSSIM